MTAPKIDTQAPERAEVEELARRLDRGDQMNGKTVNCKHDACNCALMSDAAEMLRALLAERDLADARAAAAAQAMRERCADMVEREGHSLHVALRHAPIPDPAAALDRLIVEARREAFEEAAKIAHDFGKSHAASHMNKRLGNPWPVKAKPMALQAIRIAAAIRARGSKEGQS